MQTTRKRPASRQDVMGNGASHESEKRNKGFGVSYSFYGTYGHYSRRTKWALLYCKIWLYNLNHEEQLPYPTEEFFCRPRPLYHGVEE